jgi:hypothetical protein
MTESALAKGESALQKEEGPMLQSVHSITGATPASSVYCHWIRESRNGQGRLVAVWIDTEMRCLEWGFPLNKAEVLSQAAVDASLEVGSIIHTKDFNPIKNRS